MGSLKFATVVLGFVAVAEHIGVLVGSIYEMDSAFRDERAHGGDGLGVGFAIWFVLLVLQTVLASCFWAWLMYRFRPRDLIAADAALGWTLAAMAAAPGRFPACRSGRPAVGRAWRAWS